MINVSKLRLVVFCFFLIGLHTRFTLQFSEGIPIPFVACGVSGFVLTLLNFGKFKNKHVTFFFSVLVITLLSMVFVPNFMEFLFERSKAGLYFMYSIFLALVIDIELSYRRREDVASLFGWGVFVLIFGSLLEVNFDIVKEASDYFRESAHLFYYDAEVRDIYQHGGIRPNLFTPEPSMLAASVVVLSTTWLLLSTSKYRHFLFLVCAVLCLVIIRSPVLFSSFFISVLVIFCEREIKNNRVRFRKNSRLRKMLILFSVVIITIVVIGMLLSTLLEERLFFILEGKDNSFILRMVAPAVIAWDILVSFPIFGAGIGGKEAIVTEITNSVSQLGIDPRYFNQRLGIAHSISNGFWEYWISFGLLGGVAIIIVLKKYTNIKNPRYLLLFFLIAVIFSSMGGGIGGVWIWTAIFFVMLAISKKLQSESQKFKDR